MRDKLISALQTLLADVYTMYHTAHGFHWNVEGRDFAQLHDFFSDIYDDVFGSADPIAENIRKMDALAPINMSDFIKLRSISEVPATDAMDMIGGLYKQNNGVIVTLHTAFDYATSLNEQGIANFLADRLDMHQKWAWQLRSFMR